MCLDGVVGLAVLGVTVLAVIDAADMSAESQPRSIIRMDSSEPPG